jgi:hypothetical protein
MESVSGTAMWSAVRAGIWAVAGLFVLPLMSQSMASTSFLAHTPGTEAPRPAANAPLGPVVREIDDGTTGDRWLLERDAAHPAGPGRLVRVETSGSGADQNSRNGQGQGGDRIPAPARRRAVIHAGDAVIVEDHTAEADARLEAVALMPAAVGEEFSARMKAGGAVVRVVALAAGRARLSSLIEVQP